MLGFDARFVADDIISTGDLSHYLCGTDSTHDIDGRSSERHYVVVYVTLVFEGLDRFCD